MKLIVAGSRRIADYRVVKTWILRAWVGWDRPSIDLVIHGGAVGVDSVAGEWAKLNGIPVQVFPADWKTHGLKAGPIRNQEMADACDPEIDGLVAIPGATSKGTWDMVRRARERCLRVYVAESS